MSSAVQCVSTPAPGTRRAVIWLPWQDWQFEKSRSVPRTRLGGQSPQSASAISAVIGVQPRSERVPVLQNQASSWRE